MKRNASMQAKTNTPAFAGEEFKARDLAAATTSKTLRSMGLFLGLGVTWAVVMPLDAAIVAQGTVAFEDSLKKVQHPTGGVVGAILVKEGQEVKEGDVLIRMDETAVRANLSAIGTDLISSQVRLMRLYFENQGKTTFEVPAAQGPMPQEFRNAIEGERSLFLSRLQNRKSLQEQSAIAAAELEGLQPLIEQRLVSKQRVTQLQREVAKLDGMVSEMASEISKDIRETETKIAELKQKKITAEDQLTKIEIKSPVSGIVNQLNVHTVGGVINPAETLALIVPSSGELIVEAKVKPTDINQIYTGLATRVRFSGLAKTETPEVWGKVMRKASSVARDEITHESYYTIAVQLNAAEVKQLTVDLVTGMPAEVFIKTGERTFASYILKPFTDQMARAFKEH